MPVGARFPGGVRAHRRIFFQLFRQWTDDHARARVAFYSPLIPPLYGASRCFSTGIVSLSAGHCKKYESNLILWPLFKQTENRVCKSWKLWPVRPEEPLKRHSRLLCMCTAIFFTPQNRINPIHPFSVRPVFLVCPAHPLISARYQDHFEFRTIAIRNLTRFPFCRIHW